MEVSPGLLMPDNRLRWLIRGLLVPANTALWSVGGFTFDLIASTVLFQNFGFLFVSGTGIITGNGQTFDGTWMFTSQGPGQAACFPFLPRVMSPTAVLRLLCWDWHWRESKASAENL